MHLPRRHRHETQRLHGCAADYAHWERRPAPRAKISAKTGGRPFGTRSFQAEHREDAGTDARDRKSTRLNSSHRCISYAVFCLKKKKKKKRIEKNKYKETLTF